MTWIAGLWRAVLVVVLSGVASQYSAGLMQEVVENRQAGRAWVSLPAELPEVDGYIAVVDCGQLGQVWWIRPRNVRVVGQPGQELGQEPEQRRRAGEWERHLVVDCARVGDGTIEWMRSNGIVLEVSYRTAERWGIIGRGVSVDVAVKVAGYRGPGLVP